MVRSGAVTGVSLPEPSAPFNSPFGSTLAPASFGAPPPTFGVANIASEPPLFQLPSHTTGVSFSGLNILQAAPACSVTGMVQSSIPAGGSPRVGFNMNPQYGGGVVQPGSLEGNPLADPFLLGMGQSGFFGGNHQALGGSTPQAGGVPFQPQLLSGSGMGDTVNQNNNPFLF